MFTINLKAARVNQGLSQKEVAVLLGIHPHTLMHWETGRSYPRADQFLALCRIYQCPADVIFLQ